MTYTEYMRNYHKQKPSGANPATGNCLHCSKEFTYKPWLKRRFCSVKCAQRHGKGIYRDCLTCNKNIYVSSHRINQNYWCSISCAMTGLKGEKARAWQGGKANKRESWQGSRECREWRKAVYARDGRKCCECGATEETGIRLEVDHIKPWAYFPELRGKVSNGRVMCAGCHYESDTYGNKAKVMYGTYRLAGKI